MLKIDSGFGFGREFHATETLVQHAQNLEELGYDGLMVAEIAHDPFMPLANIGHDLNAYSKGRFTLGLGSQIKPHITKRFSMPWHGPAKQMRELIEAMHAIWDCWYEGKPLQYEGEFYNHRLMTPEFTPQNTEFGRPKVLMAAVGPLMMETAAAVADGIIVHSFCTEKHFREVMQPKLAADLAAHGKSLEDFEVQYPVFVAAGDSDEELAKSIAGIKYRLGFYASTPAYKTVLDTHGWGDLQPKLNRMTKEGHWDKLPGMINDEVLEAFAVVGSHDEVARQLRDRFSDIADRVALGPEAGPDGLQQQMAIIRGQA